MSGNDASSAQAHDSEDEADTVSEQRHSAQLVLAATARATLDGTTRRKLTLAANRRDPSRATFTTVAPNNFRDADFMAKIEESDETIDVAHIDISLPAAIPINLKGPVEVAIDDKLIASATLVPPATSEPDKAAPAQMKTLVRMATRAVLGLGTVALADSLEKESLEMLREALGADDATFKSAVGALNDPKRIVQMMRKDQAKRKAGLGRHQTEFAEGEGFSMWQSAEKATIKTILANCDAFEKDPDGFVARKRAAIEAGLEVDLAKIPEEPVDDIGARKSSDGNVVFWWQLCLCCCKKDTSALEPGHHAMQRRRDSLANARKRHPKKDGIQAESYTESAVDAASSFQLDGEEREKLSPEVGFVWLIVRLLRRMNKDTNTVIRVSANVIQKQESTMMWMNDVCLYIIDCWCKRFGTREASRDLVLLEFLTRHPQITSDYFWAAMDLYEPLADLRKGNALTLIEMPALSRLAAISLQWGHACLSAYHDNFNGDLSFQGLGECVQLTKVCRELTSTTEQLAAETQAGYIDRICEIALTQRYAYLVEAARKMDQDHQNKMASAVKEATASPAPAPTRKSKSKKGSGGGGVRAAPPPEPDTCRIDTTLHLIFLMQLLKKEIDTDIQHFGPILEMEAGFNAAKETSTLYFPLIWTDLQLYLRTAVDKIEVDRAEHGNSPDCLDPYIFKLYDELKTLYDFFAPNVDLPDIVVGSHFAPFVERWLEIQKDQFSGSRVDAAIASDAWKPIGETKCSTSVIDLFALLYPLADAFHHAPYSSAQSLTFADLLSSTICYYVKKLEELLSKDIQNQKGNIDLVMSLRLNDIQVCKKKLSDLLLDIKLEKAYGLPPKLTEAEVALTPSKEDTDALATVLTGDISPANLSALRCTASFKFIQDTLDRVALSMTEPMNKLWAALITELALNKPIEDPMNEDAIEVFLQPLWEDLVPRVEEAIKALFDPHFVLRGYLQAILCHFEAHIVPESKKTALLPGQSARLNMAIQLVTEFFVFYNLPGGQIDGMKAMLRVKYLIVVVSGPTEDIIGMWGALPDEKEKMSEEERCRAAPYLSRKHLRRILERRKKLGDEAAKSFLKENKKGWF